MTEVATLKDNKGVTEEQRAFIESDIRSNIILIACAGSGKSFSAIKRMQYLVEQGVDPSKIIFFSFTTAATEELKSRIQNDAIKISTIHSFCLSILSKVGKFKKVASFYDFIHWFKEQHKPKSSASSFDRSSYYSEIEKLYDDAEFLSSHITSYKLQMAGDIKYSERMPDYVKDYQKFLKATKSRDFSDMLIEVRNLLKEDKYLRRFRGIYDYILLDEFQDTSTIQFQILLSLNAKHYYLIGDRAQSLYGYSGANCYAIEEMLKKRRKTVEMTLSINFRSSKLIVENSNNYTNLKAIAYHQYDGEVNKKIILFEDLVELLREKEEIVVLVRTNAVIRELEKQLLKLRIPMKYFNYLTPAEIDDLIKGSERVATKRKVSALMDEFVTPDALVSFIRDNNKEADEPVKRFITTIHRFKGKEAHTAVIVNSLSPEILQHNELVLNKEQIEAVSFDPANELHQESQNVHYVAVSRAKQRIFYMIFGI